MNKQQNAHNIIYANFGETNGESKSKNQASGIRITQKTHYKGLAIHTRLDNLSGEGLMFAMLRDAIMREKEKIIQSYVDTY
ncbi:MAG: hypothetical protein COV36_04845 [Alphaproteobacteria bacterium CG11_big_fil_rev_8_21_14_0_20_44_7]|nr:MAG: hypothetical protein COV36_04845 [Alphaproteobacteria bacterium CG11_big_fil_rev_8_21_14_0_20_44_7]